MDINNLKGLMEAYQQVNAPQEVDEAKQSFPAKKVAKQMEKARKGSVYGKELKNEPSPQVSDSEKKETRRYSKMFHASEKAKREKQEADKARRSSTFYKDTHPASSPKMKKANEELDIFDVVLEFLQAEGYAETLEEAEWMMANMIDEEAIDIILGEGNPIARFLSNRKHRLRDTEKGHEDIMRRNKEYQTKGKGPGGYRNKGAGRVEKVREEYMDEAQEARNNPEKYEREQSKKYAPVRGEKTPMPPRGDKRREDFEKWYAKQMGR